MPCPTCDHTLQSIGHGNFWCPRCGTLCMDNQGHPEASDPALVGRCRDFRDTMLARQSGSGFETWFGDNWRRLGIAESINTPENRPS